MVFQKRNEHPDASVPCDSLVTLSTFPRKDKDFSREFTVPRDWLMEQIAPLQVDLEYFLDGYVWEDTLPIFCEARRQQKILRLYER